MLDLKRVDDYVVDLDIAGPPQRPTRAPALRDRLDRDEQHRRGGVAALISRGPLGKGDGQEERGEALLLEVARRASGNFLERRRRPIQATRRQQVVFLEEIAQRHCVVALASRLQ